MINRCWRAHWEQERWTARHTMIHVNVRASGPTPLSAFTPTWALRGWVSASCVFTNMPAFFWLHTRTSLLHTQSYTVSPPLPHTHLSYTARPEWRVHQQPERQRHRRRHPAETPAARQTEETQIQGTNQTTVISIHVYMDLNHPLVIQLVDQLRKHSGAHQD